MMSGRKRFNDDQIKSLETTFESESRPELHLKQHLANRLGLHPRQIAIWFQNKRARSKSKEVERDFSILKSNYNNLASQLEALRKENQSLVAQVQTLRKMSEEKEKKNEMRLASPENSGVVVDMKSKEESREYFSCQNRLVENVEFKEKAGVFDMTQVVEDESCTFLDDRDCDSFWWEF